MKFRSPRPLPALPFTLLCLASACTGSIGDFLSEPESDSPAPTTPGPSSTGVEPGPAGGTITTPPESPTTALDPGRVTLRRLTRSEYNNTVRDLLGTRLRPADAFAADPIGHGFDNNGDVQTLTASAIEQYEAAASALIDEAFTGGLAEIAAAARRDPCAPESAACFSDLVGGFVKRAWRRPASADELGRLADLAAAARAAGADAVAALKTALTAVLMTPHFLFRAETETPGGAAHALGDYEVASRLSYLLYGSMPDDALFAAAAAGDLRSRRGVAQQVDRMLTDGKAAGFVENFAGQWLDVRELDSHDVDPKLFPEFNAGLRDAMKAEAFGFFRHFLAEGIGVDNLLTARFTYLNPLLARHYGMDGARSGLAPLTSHERGGLLTQAAVLTATSAPNETNPVARGNWVLTKLLCAPPPPPPPNVPPPPETAPTGTTARARFEAHRTDPVCASCHQLMDPIGFGLEHYDAIGRYRTVDNGGKVDARGVLPGGTAFDGAIELSTILGGDPKFGRCLARNLFIYAFGRDPEDRSDDVRFLDDAITSASAGGVLNLKRLITAVATTDAFRMRSVEGFASQGAQP